MLVPLQQKHMEPIRRWRNEQIEILRQQQPITKQEQERYWKEVLLPLQGLKQPSQLLFAIKEHGKLVGYCGLTHIDWTSSHCELTFLLDTKIPEGKDHFASLFLLTLHKLIDVARECCLKRFEAEVYAFRKPMIAILKKSGFIEVGRLRQHVQKGTKEFDSVLLSKRLTVEPQRALLVTSVSKKTALITAIRNAMGSLGEHFRLIGCDKDPKCLGQYSVDQFWTSPLWSDRKAKERLLSFCKENGVLGIIPTRDAELQFFARLKKEFLEAGIAIHCSSSRHIPACQDKFKFMSFCVQNKLPAIASFLSCRKLPESVDGYVVKERFSTTPKNIAFYKTREEVEENLLRFQDPLIQPRLSGVEYSIDLYRSQYSKKAVALVRRRDVIVDTEAYLTTPIEHPRLEQLAIQAASELHLYGHVLFQAIETKEKELFFIECNPRVGGASTASFANGLDSLEWFIQEEILKQKVVLPKKLSGPFLPQVRIRADVAVSD